MTTIETDYLVVGAGASGMAFTDTLVAGSDADVVMVDRRHAPGGHWNDDYPFVRLHTPSAIYGVDSRPLGNDRIDETGANAGFYERATGAEVCDYYRRVLEEQLLATGRVRFVGMSDYDGSSGEHRITSRVNGAVTTVRVRRALVDATQLESTIPSKHTPSFEVDPAAQLIPPNDLVDLPGGASGFTVIGAGKTAMDACCWLIDNGVVPEDIRWIRPRDAWTMDRANVQPMELVGGTIRTFASVSEAAAEADDVDDLTRRLEAAGVFLRLDPEVEPGVFRAAILSETERETLRRITDVVRLGRVRSIAPDRIDLDEGSLPTDAGQVHVDCTAAGLGIPEPTTIFEPDRITIQRVQAGNDPFSGALIGFVEALGGDFDRKNALCPPNAFVDSPDGFARGYLGTMRARMQWMAVPEVMAWTDATRLSMLRGAADHLADPELAPVLMRMLENTPPAIENLERILAPVGAAT